MKNAEFALSVKPDDPEANLTVGRYYCFVRKNWELGLPLLVKGKDAKLAAVAKLELTQPTEASQQEKLGATWYDLARKIRKAADKAPYLRRSRDWYERAQAGATGLIGLRIAKRLEELYKLVSASGKIPITKGLVGAWNLNEGKGKKAIDASGKGFHGEIRGTTPRSWVNGGRLGRVVLEFDGRSTYVKLDRTSTWNSLEAFTVAMWVYKNPASREFMVLLTRQDGTTIQESFSFAFTEGRLYCLFHPEGGGERRGIREDEPFPTGKWHHVAVTYGTSGLKLYRDGKQTQHNPGARGRMKSEKNPMILGGNQDGVDDVARAGIFSGKIARVRIYNRELSAAEIDELAKTDR